LYDRHPEMADEAAFWRLIVELGGDHDSTLPTAANVAAMQKAIDAVPVSWTDADSRATQVRSPTRRAQPP
jgi:hypothetical protein